MKKRWMRAALAALMCLVMFGCGAKSSITLGEYKGFTYQTVDVTVTQEEIDAYVEKVLDSKTTQEEDPSRKGTKVEDGDTLWIDYVGYVDGTAFEGGDSKGNGTSLTIGSGTMIDGFESSLIGKTVGETTTIDVTFPDPYKNNPDLAGKDATFDVTIHYVCRDVRPEYTDEFVNEYTSGTYTTTEEFEEYLYEQMLAQKQSEATQTILEDIRTQALAQCTFDLKDADSKVYYNEFKTYYTNLAKQYGYSLEDYLALAGSTMEDFETTASDYARDTLCQKLFYSAVAAKEGMSVTDEEYEARIDTYLARYGYTDNREEFEKTYDLDLIRENMLFDMVNEKLLEWNTPARAE